MVLNVVCAILSLSWAACPATAASLLTNTLVARAGIEAFGSVEAAQEAVQHAKVLEFRDSMRKFIVWPCVFLLHF